MLIAAWHQTGLVRVGIILGALGFALGAAVRLAGGSLELRYAMAGLLYLGSILVIAGIVRQRRTRRPHLTGGT